MTEKEKEIKAFLSKVIRNNMIQLFDLSGYECSLDYQRHICSTVKDVPGNTLEEKIQIGVHAACILLKLWLIHLEKCQYSLKYYGCVQVEKEWITRGKGAPPYVILTSIKNEMVKKNPDFFEISEKEVPNELLKAIEGLFLFKEIRFYASKNDVWRIEIDSVPFFV
jgi:hypothetical protein